MLYYRYREVLALFIPLYESLLLVWNLKGNRLERSHIVMFQFLTSCSKPHNKNLQFPQVVKNDSTFHGYRRFFTLFTKVCYFPMRADVAHSVGIATRYWPDRPEIEYRCGRGFPHPSRPVLGATQPLITGVKVFFVEGKAAEAWRWPPTPICRQG